MPLRALFLDVGETLLTTVPARFEIYAEAARRRGLPVGPRDMAALMSGVHHELPDRVDGGYRYSDPWFSRFIELVFGRELGFGPAEVAEITVELFARFQDPACFRVYPGAHELLARARREGLVLGVISNWSARLPVLLERLGLAAAFDFVLASALEGAEKPAPTLFERALERAAVEAPDALHAGDHLRLDVEAALALGLQAAHVDHTATTRADPGGRANAWRTVHGLEELERAILGPEP